MTHVNHPPIATSTYQPADELNVAFLDEETTHDFPWAWLFAICVSVIAVVVVTVHALGGR